MAATSTSTALAVQIYPPYSVQTVKVEPIPVPELDPASLLIKVHSSTLTTGELGWFAGMSHAVRPGYEVAGTVIKTGSEVTRFNVGDSIMALINYKGTGLSEITIVEEHAASTIPMNYLTALQALHTHAHLPTTPSTTKKSILIHGVSGAVGIYTALIAHHLNLTSIGTASSSSPILKRLGVHVIPHTYTPSDVLPHTPNSQGVDIILDTVGGADIISRGYEVINKTNGPSSSHYITLIVEGGVTVFADYAAAFAARGKENNVHAELFVVKSDGKQLEEGLPLLENWLDVVRGGMYDEKFRFGEEGVRKAYETLVRRDRKRGKIVVEME
ncbi:hypothetical protein HDV00_009993 [Rhizophlyctis rosea]|nr:hypothetical protein HDV00_009993 [Rhizophlyctis rosea]